MTTGHMPIGRLPALTGTIGPGMTQTERLGLLRNCAMDNSSPLAARVAAVLVLLFAQPLTRIRVLTLDDIIVGDDDVAIRLGDPPSGTAGTTPSCSTGSMGCGPTVRR